jgi:hypothetical protein
MRRHILAAVALAVLVWATPAASQDYKSSVGWSGGVLYTTSLNDGASGGESFVDLKPDLTWVVGAHYDYWIRNGRVGVQGHGGVGRQVLPWNQGDRSIYEYMGDLSLILRPVAPTSETMVLPFLSGGVGATYWELGDGPTTSFAPSGAKYSGDKFKPAAVAGLGLDFVTPWIWGEGPVVVRLAVKDYIQLSSNFSPIEAEAGDFGIVHNGMVTLGFHTGMGLLSENR